MAATTNDQNDSKKAKESASGEKRSGGLAKVKDVHNAHEILEVAKNVPQARFGHTITMVHKYNVVLFGGATGDTGKYSMTGETFIFNILLKTWTELSGKYPFQIISISSSQGRPSITESGPRLHQRRADADGGLRRSHRWRQSCE